MTQIGTEVEPLKEKTTFKFKNDTHANDRAGYILLFSNIIASVLISSTILFALSSAFNVSLYMYVPLCVSVVFCSLVYLAVKNKILRTILIILLIAALGVLLFFGFDTFVAGMNIFLNSISDTIGIRDLYIYPHFEVSVPAAITSQYVTLFFAVLAILTSAIGVYVVKKANYIFLLLLFMLLFVAAIIFDIEVSAATFILLTLSLVMIIYRIHTLKSSFITKKAGVTTLLSILVITFVVVSLTFVFDSIFKNTDSAYYRNLIEHKTHNVIDNARFEKGNSKILTQGDFTNIRNLEFDTEDKLLVTMSKPDSLYLRGFIGGNYSKNGWSGVDKSVTYSYVDTFYQLHSENFYGQTQLSSIASLLDKDLSENDINSIQIENVGSSSKFIYTPYELNSAPQDLLDPRAIGDENLRSNGLFGDRLYTYTAVPNQVKRYNELVSKLQAAEALDNDAAELYLIDESHYNEYVYKAYTEVPDELRELFMHDIGAYDYHDNPHAPYQFTKQKILDYLNEKVSYSEELDLDQSNNIDVVTAFLTQTHQGYSVHYASAATLLFRYFGIPARYVEGYIITPDDVSGVTSDSTLAVNGTRVHAWTEFYQDGIGWIPFETTPPYINLMEQPEALHGYSSNLPEPEEIEDPELESEEMTRDNYEEGVTEDFYNFLETFYQFLPYILVILLLLLIVMFLIRYFIRNKRLKLKLERIEDQNRTKAILNNFKYNLELLSAFGIEYSGESIDNFTKTLSDKFNTQFAQKFLGGAHIYSEARFSNHRMSTNEWEVVNSFTNNIKQKIESELSWLKRFKLKYWDVLYK